MFAVALYARAWVEISQSPNRRPDLFSRPLREGVGRNTTCKAHHLRAGRRPLREGVGRNLRKQKKCAKVLRRPLREGVGRNTCIVQCSKRICRGRPLREGVGRNICLSRISFLAFVALYARAWVEIDHSLRPCCLVQRRPLREGVGRNWMVLHMLDMVYRSPSTRGRG